MTYVMADSAIDGKADLNDGLQKTTGNIVNLLIASIIVGVIVLIGMVLLVIPGLLALYFLMFSSEIDKPYTCPFLAMAFKLELRGIVWALIILPEHLLCNDSGAEHF